MQLAFGAELEFYYSGSTEGLQYFCKTNIKESLFWCLKQEDGENQFEVVFYPTQNYQILSDQINTVREKLKDFGANFSAKINDSLSTNSLQISVSFGIRVKKEVVSSMFCAILPEESNIIAPTENCRERLLNSDNLMRRLLNIPKFICWGIDNRTAMVRVIQGSRIYNRDNILLENSIFNNLLERSERFEYRAASSLADPLALIELLRKKLTLKQWEFKIIEPVYVRSFDLNGLPTILTNS